MQYTRDRALEPYERRYSLATLSCYASRYTRDTASIEPYFEPYERRYSLATLSCYASKAV